MKSIELLGALLVVTVINAIEWTYYAYAAWCVLDWFTPFGIQYRTVLGVEIFALVVMVAFAKGTNRDDEDDGIIWPALEKALLKSIVVTTVLGAAWVINLIVR